MELMTAKGDLLTYGEGCHLGNFNVQGGLYEFNGTWAGHAFGSGAGGNIVVSLWGGQVIGDREGPEQVYQGIGRITIAGGGAVLADDQLAVVTVGTVDKSVLKAIDPNFALNESHRVELPTRVQVSFTTPAGAFGLLSRPMNPTTYLQDATHRSHIERPNGLSVIHFDIAHVAPAAPGALKRALRGIA